jgi:hypothetical protein
MTIRGCFAGDSLINQGTIRADTAAATIRVSANRGVNEGMLEATAGTLVLGGTWTNGGTLLAGSWTNTGTLAVSGGGTCEVSGDLQVNGLGVLAADGSGGYTISGSLLGDTTNVALYTPSQLDLCGSGTEAAPQQLEVMSQDLGPVPAGFESNFAYGGVAISPWYNSYIRLVDQADNVPGATPEALYVDNLVVSRGATLDLNGLHVYARSTRIGGTVIGGTVQRLLTVTVDPVVTGDRTPALTGTVSEPGAAIAVTVAGRTYAAINRFDGTWLLRDNAIVPPLAPGVYDVAVVASVAGDAMGIDTTTDELTIGGGPDFDTTAPRIVAPADLEVVAPDAGGVTIADLGQPTVTDDLDPAPAVRNDAPASKVFPVGVTTVTWRATDWAGNWAEATQRVTVRPGQRVICVNANAVGANNGRSWRDAFAALQDALVDAVAGDQVWIAAGTYRPTSDYGLVAGPGEVQERLRHFELKNGVAIYGGFPATGNPTMAERNWVTHPTLLSGDLDTDGSLSAGDAYHVFYHRAGTALNGTAVLDGCVVTGGNANGESPVSAWGVEC